MSNLLVIVIAYFVGSLPIGLVVARLVRRIDIREHGSGNIGASNVWRIVGRTWGVVVFLLDVVKGLAPTALARHTAGAPHWLPVAAGLAAILGHNFSPFLGFRGGKGVATSLGVAFGLSLPAGLIGFGCWLGVLAITGYISVASVIGTTVGSILIWQFNQHRLPYGLFALMSACFVIVKHVPNMRRLRAGTEPKIKRKPA